MKSDLRREKQAWVENRGHFQGGIPYTDDIAAPTPRTRLESVQEHLPHLLPFFREKQTSPAESSDTTNNNDTSNNSKAEAHHRNGRDGDHGVDGVGLGVGGATRRDVEAAIAVATVAGGAAVAEEDKEREKQPDS